MLGAPRSAETVRAEVGIVLMRRLGHVVTRYRWAVLVVTLLLLPVAAVLGGPVKGRLSSGGFSDEASESRRAAVVLQDVFETGAPNVVLLVTAAAGTAGVDDPAVAERGQALTAELAATPKLADAVSYWSIGGAPPLRSTDGRQALVLGRVAGDEDALRDAAERIAERFGGRDDGVVSVGVGGFGETFRAITEQAEADLQKAEALSMPVTLLLLLLVFGSAVAAALPLGVGIVAVLGTFLVLTVFTAFTQVSVFALNLTTAMGLGLAIDYSLFIVSRFREELAAGRPAEPALLRTMQTAGRTVAFSAFTVAISLAALLVFPLAYLRSFAYAGVGVVALAAVGALVVLPALLAVLGPRVDKGRIPWPRRRREGRDADEVASGFWYRRAHAVMRRPLPIAIGVVVVLVLLGLPFLGFTAGQADDRVLPESAPVRGVHDALRTNFASNESSALTVVSEPGSSVDPTAIEAYAAALSTVRGVARVDALTGYYLGGARVKDADALSQRFAGRGEGSGGTWLSVVPSVEPYSPAGERLVADLRDAPSPFPVLVGGQTADLVDSKASLGRRLPLALGLIVVATFVLLFLMTGSVVVPLKALLLNLLSLSATFGMLVWVFEDGHLSGLLDFTPTGSISVHTPILLFCIAFGLSMDYEVFLLSRIKEEYDLGETNEEAVALGLEKTGRIVTAAALLLAVVFVAFATAEVSVVKVFGVGLTLAVLVDAFLIRTLLVPAFMKMAGRLNWWAPRPLRRFHLRYGIWETDPSSVLDLVERADRMRSETAGDSVPADSGR
ncbi:MAG TPA: MMPL family transporter [Acidimicrobiales bacterium]|nr:MMPL family transporter [Acidimicrobiales bacterium]